MSIGNVVSIIIIIAIVAYFGIKFYIKLKNNEDTEKYKKVFNTIRNAIEDAMIDYLKNIDISNIANINDMQKSVLTGLYDRIFSLVVYELIDEIAQEDSELAQLIKTIATRENIENMVNQIYNESIKMQEMVTVKYNDTVLAAANIDK